MSCHRRALSRSTPPSAHSIRQSPGASAGSASSTTFPAKPRRVAMVSIRSAMASRRRRRPARRSAARRSARRWRRRSMASTSAVPCRRDGRAAACGRWRRRSGSRPRAGGPPCRRRSARCLRAGRPAAPASRTPAPLAPLPPRPCHGDRRHSRPRAPGAGRPICSRLGGGRRFRFGRRRRRSASAPARRALLPPPRHRRRTRCRRGTCGSMHDRSANSARRISRSARLRPCRRPS